MNPRQPTRWLKTNITVTEVRQTKIKGRIQVGRWTIDSKVGLGLKITPKIRPIELTCGAGSGGIAGVAMFSLRTSNGVEVLFPSSITFKRSDKLQRQSVPRFSRISERLSASRKAGNQPQSWAKILPKLYGNLRHGSDKRFGIRIFRSAEYLPCGANFHDLSATHYRNSGGELRDYWKTMRDKNYRKRKFALKAGQQL